MELASMADEGTTLAETTQVYNNSAKIISKTSELDFRLSISGILTLNMINTQVR